MAIQLTIAEAEAAHLAELQRRKQIKSREVRRQGYGVLGILVAVVICGVLHFTLLPGALLASAVLLPFAIVLGIIYSVEGSESVSPLGSSLNAIRLAQTNWIESHGFKLPVESFAQLAFPVLLDGAAPQIYGVAQLIETSTDRLQSISLRSTPEAGYQLFGTDGEVLKPVLTAV